MVDGILAYFITWTTYGTWLPGDKRGWVTKGRWVVLPGDPAQEELARSIMTEEMITLSSEQRKIVDEVIVNHCQKRKWTLHARNVRTNHVHVVVTADIDGQIVREQLKAWGSRKLSDHAGLPFKGKNGRRRWWTEKGDVEFIFDEEHLFNAIRYVLEMQ